MGERKSNEILGLLDKYKNSSLFVKIKIMNENNALIQGKTKIKN